MLLALATLSHLQDVSDGQYAAALLLFNNLVSHYVIQQCIIISSNSRDNGDAEQQQ